MEMQLNLRATHPLGYCYAYVHVILDAYMKRTPLLGCFIPCTYIKRQTRQCSNLNREKY